MSQAEIDILSALVLLSRTNDGHKRFRFHLGRYGEAHA
jgi:hypothetical protein